MGIRLITPRLPRWAPPALRAPGEVRGVLGVRTHRVGVQATPLGGRGPAGAGLQSRSGGAVSHQHRREQSCPRMRDDLRPRRELKPGTGFCLSGAREPLGPAAHQVVGKHVFKCHFLNIGAILVVLLASVH
ncbi:hypothetical protein NDU88_006804 [Pleurodeles waltl]|uniref:Uncharacterized protein n=1 Tax=Pleurodeles waltl TaxID=8319 RepID=A0AAV7LRH8_PLEWA|nr:hypothetical protein NDU88_006804 [Pleurodeles waltl]